MADWTDGAQYAPTRRPAAFAMPVAEPLEATPEPPHVADGQPSSHPGSYAEPDQVPALRDLVPATGPGRDPNEPFPAEGAADGSWAAAHAHWEPTMPLGEVTEPEPMALSPLPTQAFPPPSGTPVVPVAPEGSPAGQLPPPTGEPVRFPPPATAALPAGFPTTAPRPTLPGDPYAAGPVAAPLPPASPAALDQLPPPVAREHVPVPSQGQLAPQPLPPVPDTPAGHLSALLGGLGPVMLGALAFGVVVPFFSVIAYIVASVLSSRSRIGNRLMRPAWQAASLVFFIGLVWSYASSSAPDFNTVCQWMCGALFVLALVAGHLDLRSRR